MMNNQIKHFWWVARIGYNNQSCEDEVLEKFVELIVKECASRVDHILREKSLGGGTYADDIKEHFGIE